MIRVEITEELLKDGATTYHQGDVVAVDDDKYELWVNQLGWAKDPETGEQAERKPGAQAIKAHSVTQKGSS